MTDKITEPVAPEVLNPAPLGPLSGDWKDDDPGVYESDFQAADHRPEKMTGVPHPVEAVKPNTRILTASATIGTVGGSVQDPIMLMPADPNRKALTIVSTANGAAGTWILGSAKSDCFNGFTQTAQLNANTVLSLDAHTGAVWVYSQSSQTVGIYAVAVTV